MDINIKSKDIDATLKHGQVFSGKFWKAFFIGMYAVIAFLLLAVLAMIMSLIFGEFHPDIFITVIGVGCASLLLLIIFICLQRWICSYCKKVDIWLQDAVILSATTVSKGEQLIVRGKMGRMGAAIEVRFKYNDKHYVRQSVYKDKLSYMPVYRKYTNRTITIAYSPQHDEVMLIKPESLFKVEK